jgi:hypothetical protein
MAHRIIAADTVALKPAPPGGTQGYATNVAPGTVIPAEWHNSVQDELINVIALKGGTPDPTNDTQLAEVLGPSVLAVEGGSVFQGAPVQATNGYTRAVIACDTGSAGAVSASIASCLAAAGFDVAASGSQSAVVASAKARTLGATSFVAAVDARTGVGLGTRTDVITSLAECAALVACKRDNFLTVAGSYCFGAGSQDLDLDADGACAIGSRDVVMSSAYSAAAGCRHVQFKPDGSSGNNGAVATLGWSSGQRVLIGSPTYPVEASGTFAVKDGSGTATEILGNSAAVIAAGNVQVTQNGLRAAALGQGGGSINANEAVLMAGNGNSIGSGATRSTIIGGSANVNSKANSHMLACESSLVGSSGRARVAMIAALNIDSASSAASTDWHVMGGARASTGAPLWRIDSTIGQFLGTVAATTGGLDYAEYFENADGVEHLPGRLVARVGRKVTLGQPGLRAVGPVSTRPSFVGGDDGLGWSQQFATDEWGRPELVDFEAPDGSIGRALRVNPEYRPELAAEHRPRSARPAEWTLVGLVGQVLIAVEEGVSANDFLCCGVDGLGRTSAVETRLEVMEITRPFDAAKGYAQALVLVR